MTTLRRLSILLLVLSLGLAAAPPALADSSYTVQPGDTLTKIAARFDVTVEAIAAANHLSNPNSLRVGQVLTIPDGAAPPVPPAPAVPAAAPAAPPAPSEGAIYIVQNGDSLSRVAARFNVTLDALIAANRLTSSTLQVGQILVIPGAAQASTATIYSRIQGSPAFIRRVRAALDWMQANDAEAYGRVDTYVTVITPSAFSHLAMARPLPGGGCQVRALARQEMSVTMTAALLYHEASHCYQFATVGVLSTKQAEVYAYTEQIAFMERHGFPPDQIEYYRRVLAYYAGQPDDGQYIPPPDF
jgi:LysM repeat protein